MAHLTTFKRVATLPCKKIVCKNCGDEAQWQQTRRAHSEENVNVIQLIVFTITYHAKWILHIHKTNFWLRSWTCRISDV